MHNIYIKETYVEKYDSWLGILVAAEFAIVSATNRLKGYRTGKLVSGRDIIIPIKHKADR